jgi:hypothetical protein
MGLFSGIKAAKVSEGGDYIKAGVYPELEIQEFKSGKTRKGDDFVVAKVKVIKSSGPTASLPGAECDWMVMMKWDGSLGHLKGFLAAAVCDGKIEDVDDAGAEEAIGKDQPLKGLKIAATAHDVTTRAGGTYTKVKWSVFNQADADACVVQDAPAAPAKSGMFAKK